jgi:hypothetical protein
VGFFDKLLGRKPCPKCGCPLDLFSSDGENGALCKRCDLYVKEARGGTQPVSPDRIALRPWFAVPLPWRDVRAVQEGPVIEFDANSEIMRMLTTKDAGVRRLEANWPEGCCVCGKPAVRVETVTRNITIPRHRGAIAVGEQTITLLADSIPHCGEDKGGVAFGKVRCATPLDYQHYGLLFRSLHYRNAFRALNPWEWVEH